MTDRSKQQSGYSGSPITYPRASRRTEEQPQRTRQQTTRQQIRDDDENDDAWTVEKPHTSAYRYDYPVTPPRNATRDTHNPKRTQLIKQRRFSPSPGGLVLLIVGLGTLAMLLGWIALTALSNWWTITQDDWHYGRPRTYQIDYVVGHHDNAAHPSHFIAQNLNRRIFVIEFPGGDPSKALTYLGPTLLGDGQDLTPVTLSFEDRNGDGKPDLNIHIGDQVIVFLNDGTKFNSPPHQ